MMASKPTELPSFGTIEAHGWAFVMLVRDSLKKMKGRVY